MQQVKIIIDNRERNSEIISRLESKDAQIELKQAPVGDYIVSDRVCIERKTHSDLQGSVINARLFDQLDRLGKSFEKPILILEMDEHGFNLGDNIMLGILASVYLDHNVQVMWSKGPRDTADIIYALAAREQVKNKREPRLVGIKRAYTDYQWQTLILCSIPGVGPKLARDLIKKFKNIRSIANAQEKELMLVEKIGKKKAHRIYEVLNSEQLEEK